MSKYLPEHVVDRGRRPAVSWGRERRKALITHGLIPTDGDGFVYIGVSPVGRIKVGMTSDPDGRAKTLGIEMRVLMPVVPAAAKEVETLTLQLLGHEQGDGEWLRKPDLPAAIAALDTAMAKLRRRIWVDPQLSEEEARLGRVKMLVDEREEQKILLAPDRKSRKISITSHRRVAGMRSAYGGRFG